MMKEVFDFPRRMPPLLVRSFGPLLIFVFIACMPAVHPPGNVITTPRLTGDAFITGDGARLPVRSWMPETNEPKALIIAVHGFNDYSNFFASAGEFLSTLGIGSYAFDQRGFGAAPNRGFWSGVPAYAHDLFEFSRRVREKHPLLPLYLLGESMGGAVVIVAMNGIGTPDVDGVILSAPAVWGREAMPWYQRTLLWVTAHTLPWMTLTGESMEIVPSDNIEMLRALGRDPLVIKETRVEAIYGLVDLMDEALRKSSKLTSPTLFLYGEKDEIIPKAPILKTLQSLPTQDKSGPVHVAFYENGYHMLLRDLQAPVLLRDIAAWIESPKAPLPSGADRRGLAKLLAINRSDEIASSY
ncbi:MAG: lysophospholipase [Methylococcaceae bacterium]|nr:lysophospholipase [Methylococcaceae bacterium]